MGRGVRVACRAGEDKGADPQEQPSVTVTLDRLHKHALQGRRRPAANLTLTATRSRRPRRQTAGAANAAGPRGSVTPVPAQHQTTDPPATSGIRAGGENRFTDTCLYTERSFRTCPAAIFSDFKGNFAFCSSLPYRLPSSALPLHSVCPLGPHPLRTGRRADPTSVDM